MHLLLFSFVEYLLNFFVSILVVLAVCYFSLLADSGKMTLYLFLLVDHVISSLDQKLSELGRISSLTPSKVPSC